MRVWRVGIIGGGPGGLLTAYFLQKMTACPVRTTIFEASERLGGKILTPRFQSARHSYEAGAAEFYDYSLFDEDPLKELIAELGLPISPMGGSAVIMNDRIISSVDDIRDHLGPNVSEAFLRFDQVARNRMTPQEFYHADDPEGAQTPADTTRFDSFMATVHEPAARTYIEHLIHSDLATEPAQTSVGYGLQNYLMNDPRYMRLYGIQGGNERLPEELAKRLDARCLLNQQVKHVAKTEDNRLQIISEHAGKEQQDEFDFVVVALPHNHLGSVSFAGERLANAVQRHRDFYHHPAHYLRVTILFESPFWRKHLTDSYWMLDKFHGCCLYDESSRQPGSAHGTLGWLMGGDAARDMSELSDAQLIEQALDSLPTFLQFGRDEFMEGHVHRWINAVNALPGGVSPLNLDRRHQPEPIEHPHLFFVGDYMFDSTLNGVLDSADYVAGWLAATMIES